jgi:hypothetical protein
MLTDNKRLKRLEIEWEDAGKCQDTVESMLRKKLAEAALLVHDLAGELAARSANLAVQVEVGGSWADVKPLGYQITAAKLDNAVDELAKIKRALSAILEDRR